MRRELAAGKRWVGAALRRAAGLSPAGKALTVLPDDLFVVSYPRSGNTWLRFMLGALRNGGLVDFDSIERYVPDIYLHPDRRLLNLPCPRVLKSHELYDPRYPKVIYIARDGRDVAVSYYYLRKKYGHQEEFSSFLRGWASVGRWAKHVTNWLEHREEVPNGLLFLKYEDALRDAEETVQGLSAFVGFNATAEVRQKALAASSLDAMRAAELGSASFGNSRADIRFVREGRAGVWREVFHEEDKAVFKERLGPMLVELGYERSLDW